ncbi:MAG: hypothetical protein U0223_00260 [Nitrospira sp.]|nr:hypothetical protein [Nitrospira sp.]
MKPTTNRLLCIGRVLIILTGFLLVSWDAEAANAPDPGQFFKGCSVKPREGHSNYRVSGFCLGHSFKPQHTNGCIVQWDGLFARWVIFSCDLDGEPRRMIYFDGKTGKIDRVDGNIPQEQKMVREVQTSGNYKGCTISHLTDNPSRRVITGKCAGHVFENPKIGGPLEEINVCRLQDLRNQMWIGDCIIDGRWRSGATSITYDPKTVEAAQAAAEVRTKMQAEAPAKYPDLVASARARSKADPVFLGIVLGEQWNKQNVNDCSERGWSTHNSIPFCSYPADEANTSHAGKSWTDCVVIDKSSFDTSWIGSSSAIDYSKVQQYDGLAGLIVGMTALNMAVSNAEAEAKRESCKVYVSVLPDGTVGTVSTLTSTQSAEVEKVLSLLIKKYGDQFSTNGWRHQWTLPGLTVSYHERAERADGSSSVLGGLEISTAAVAREAQRSSKPAF